MGRNVIVCLLTDTQTRVSMNGGRSHILELVDEVVSVDVGNGFSPLQRSRILKTSARNLVNGDYLFIDCDTIVLKPIEGIDNYPAEIAAVKDCHTGFSLNPYRQMCLNHCRRLVSDIPDIPTYYNSGVLLVKDTPFTREFYQKWHENWLKGRERGVNMDQPSFNMTNILMGHPVKELSGEWNCQYIHGIRFLNKAYILHYLCTNKLAKNDTASFLLRDESILMGLKTGYEIPQEIAKCFDDPFLGIPSLTHLHAGRSVGLFNTIEWKCFFSTYGTNYFKLYRYLGKMINKFRKFFKNETV